MAKTDFRSVEQYLRSQAPAVQDALKRVRATIRKALPQAEETISYQIPAYKLGGRAVLYFAGWKQHFSLYPATGGLLAALGKELAPYAVSKGTIRFPLSEPVPARLIERIARFRGRESAEGARARAKADTTAKARGRSSAKAAGAARGHAGRKKKAASRTKVAGKTKAVGKAKTGGKAR
jgi:uncharacterized protein YdhG (YjbR/CyaY superfamily)